MAEVTSMERPHPDTHTHTTRKVRRKLQHIQNRPADIEPAVQDPVFVQGQLLRSISAALVMAGYVRADPKALEMFRSHTEECEGHTNLQIAEMSTD